MNRLVPKDQRDSFNRVTAARGEPHKKVGFEITDYGVIKRRLVGDETEEDPHWKIGHPVLFPNILRVVDNMQFRVPIDDTHTLHVRLEYKHLEDGETTPAEVPFEVKPLYDETGKIKRDYVAGQDQTAWIIQGPISDRTTERLGASDVGIILYRRMLMQQMDVVADGGEPMNVWRDESKNDIIVLPVEYWQYPGYDEPGGPFANITPRKPDVEAELSGHGSELPEFVEAAKQQYDASRVGKSTFQV